MGDAVSINLRLAGDKWGGEYTRNLRLRAGLGHFNIQLLCRLNLPHPLIITATIPSTTPRAHALDNASCRGSYGCDGLAITVAHAGPPKGGFGHLSLSLAT